MSFGSGEINESLQIIIREALALGVTSLAKHTNPETIDINPLSKDGPKGKTWTIIWYSSDNMQKLQRLALFLFEKGLIPKTKTEVIQYQF